jgi:hypothetical protein
MNTNSYPGESYGSRFAESIETGARVIEAEIRYAVAYADAVVVPKVRRESASAMRLLAGHLERFAEALNADRQPGL